MCEIYAHSKSFFFEASYLALKAWRMKSKPLVLFLLYLTRRSSIEKRKEQINEKK